MILNQKSQKGSTITQLQDIGTILYLEKNEIIEALEWFKKAEEADCLFAPAAYYYGLLLKVVDIDLITYGNTKFFTFFAPIPGIEADYQKVYFDKLYPKEEIVDLDENQLRAELEDLLCCATNEDGTKNGDPLNLILFGTREDISAAFVRRGWLPAELTRGKAVWKTIKSFLFGIRYRYSPVSPLYLYGRQQAGNFQYKSFKFNLDGIGAQVFKRFDPVQYRHEINLHPGIFVNHPVQ